ncbi:hypothetical protein ACAW74_10190 [Fibrella sp. WM1]|uniref:hypothetical protein n=1 Tax=Fibrella musci TaxID=3242485 RepID=UPI003520FDCF
MKALLFCLLLAPIVASAQRHGSSPTLTNRRGTLHVSAISRGVYQYVLTDLTTNVRYVPTNLTDSLKQTAMAYNTAQRAPLPVVFSGVVGTKSSSIYEPGPTDVPNATAKAKSLRLTAIRKE